MNTMASSSAASPLFASSPIKLRGTVIPLAGHPNRVALLVDGEAEYTVLPRGAGIDLADMVSTQLEVLGSVTEGDNGRLLHVRSYTVLESSDDEPWLPRPA